MLSATANAGLARCHDPPSKMGLFDQWQEALGSCLGDVVNPTGNVEMSFIVHVELSPFTVYRIRNFDEQFFACCWTEHPNI